MLWINGLYRSFTSLYDEARLEPYQRASLNWMMTGNICGNLFGIICAGGTAAMVGLAACLGAGDFEFGLLVAIPQIAAMFQLPFSALVNRTHKRKSYFMPTGLIGRILWLPLGFFTLFQSIPSSYRLALMIILIAISSILSAMLNVTWHPWFSDLAPMSIRGRWMSQRDKIVAFTGLLFGLLVAYLLDALPEQSKYIIVFLLGGILGLLDIISHAFSVDECKNDAPSIRMRETLRDILCDKPFMRFTIMWMVWNYTAYMSGSYLVPYAMNSMNLTFLQVTLFGTVASALATVVAVPKWGQTLDWFGSRNVLLISCIGASLTPLFFLFQVPGSIWPTFLHNTIGALFWSGCNLAANSMQLSASPDDKRPTYIAVYAAATAVGGIALGTLSGSWFLTVCEKNSLFTGRFDRYQALIVLSVILRFGLTVLLVPPMKNDREGTVADAVRFMLPKAKGKNNQSRRLHD